MADVLIIGGGVIGLSLAWDLGSRGIRVRVIDRSEPAKEASWAGAGILPSAASGESASDHAYERLAAQAHRLHPKWAARLLEETGIDTGFRICGGWHLGRTAGECAALAAWAAYAREEGRSIERMPLEELARSEPGLRVVSDNGPRPCAYLDPAEAQLRNPRHLKALLAACRKANVEILSGAEVTDVVLRGNRIAELRTEGGPLYADQYCFTAGAWTGTILGRLGVSLGVVPIRGQMVLFRCRRPPIARIVNEGSRYLVPRDDGRLLAGSTEEEAGFDKRTTDEAIAELTAFARQLVPALAGATVERTWAGLRPGSFDGLPYMGRLPAVENGFVAAGHYRSGLYLSPAVAVVMSQLLRGDRPEIDLTPFGVLR